MNRILLSIAVFLICTGAAFAQASLTNSNPTTTINFSSSMQTGVGSNPSTAFTGAGFSPMPPTFPGRLNSHAWETQGWSQGDLFFGANMSNPAHGRGSVTSAVITPGIYAYTDNPASVANPTLMIQPGDGEFAPGSLTLRIRNNGTTNMTQLQVSYNLFIRNDENSSSSFNFSHSFDNVAFQDEASMDYTSPETADAFEWTMVDIAPSRSLVISGINVAPGAYYYIRWSCDDVVVNGARDEFGLDDIVLTAFYGAPAPEINVTNGIGSLSILNNDLAPQIPDGTLFANTFTGGSSSIATFRIQNLGGAPLDINSINITGTNASDFTILNPLSATTLPALVSAIPFVELRVKFTPSSAGTKNAEIVIASNDSNENPYTFRVRGIGVIPQPDIEVSGFTAPNLSIIYSGDPLPPMIGNGTEFAQQVVGGPGQVIEYRIRNTGFGANLLLGPDPVITIAGAHPGDFTIEAVPASNSISYFGPWQYFKIRFNPLASGLRMAKVIISNNDVVNDPVFNRDESPFNFTIQGYGVSPEADIFGNQQPVVSGSTVPILSNHTFFDSVNISSGFVDRTYTIENPGDIALTVGTPTLTGSAAFTLVSPPAASVPVAGSTTFTIRFDPSTIGTNQATVSIVTNDADENPYTFVVGGYGLDYIPCSTGPVETIAIQDFESPAATPAWNYATAGSNIGLTAVGAQAYGALVDGPNSNRYIGTVAMQLNNNSGGASITFASVNTQDFTDIELSVRLASMSATAVEGNDGADRAVIAVSTDGGSTWSNEIEIRGTSQAKWSYDSGSLTASAIYDGNGGSSVFVPSGNDYVSGYGTISLTNLPAVPNLRVRITLNNNNASEIWTVDNVILFGRREITTTWNGSAWSDGPPTSSIKAIINGNYDTGDDGNLAACKCEIKSGRTVIIQPNQHFHIQSDLDNFGTINIENSGSLVQRNDLADNAGMINVKRITTPMTHYDYTYWSSPVQGQTLFNLSPTTPADMFWHFNPAINNWQGLISSTIMQPAKGYIVRAPQSFSTAAANTYTGQFAGLANNGFIQTPVTGASWNLIGNPYPCAIDAVQFLSFPDNVGVLGGTIYFWTHNTPISNNVYTSNDYASFNLTGGQGTAASTPGNTSIPTGMIASGQGFFVTGLSNGQATFNNSMRVTGSNAGFFRQANELVAATPDIGTIERHRIWLNLTNSQGAFKQALVGYIQGATNDQDRDFDGIQLDGGNVLGFYSILNEGKLSIQGRALPFDNADLVPLGFTTSVSGQFTIAIDRTDGIFTNHSIFLEDKLAGIIHDLQAMPYTFTTPTGTIDNRFVLRYTDAALSVADNAFSNGLQIAVRDRAIYLQASEQMAGIEVYDLTGRHIHSQKLESFEAVVSGLPEVTQSLIVKVKFEGGSVVNKKVMLY